MTAVDLSTGYWPWWLGGVAFAVLVVGYWLVNGRSLGASGLFAKVLNWRAERENDRLLELFSSQQAELEEALAEETRKEFGALTDTAPGSAAPAMEPQRRNSHLTWSVAVTFLVSILAGGILSAYLRGGVNFRLALAPEFIRLWGSGWQPWLVLLAGGILVGFGTRMAGGCTSGHGLSGCSRLSKASFLATAVFFGTAILVSLLLRGLAS